MRLVQTFQMSDFLNTAADLAIAFALATLIGAERQYRQRTAGLHTNVLVAVGAASFADLAMQPGYATDIAATLLTTSVDPREPDAVVDRLEQRPGVAHATWSASATA